MQHIGTKCMSHEYIYFLSFKSCERLFRRSQMDELGVLGRGGFGRWGCTHGAVRPVCLSLSTQILHGLYASPCKAPAPPCLKPSSKALKPPYMVAPWQFLVITAVSHSRHRPAHPRPAAANVRPSLLQPGGEEPRSLYHVRSTVTQCFKPLSEAVNSHHICYLLRTLTP